MEDTTKVDLQQNGCEGTVWIKLAQVMAHQKALVNTFLFRKTEEFLLYGVTVKFHVFVTEREMGKLSVCMWLLETAKRGGYFPICA